MLHPFPTKSLRKYCLLGILVAITLVKLGSVIVPRYNEYTYPYYTEKVYKDFEAAFNSSQYRQKSSTVSIPDEIVFSYAAGAYLRGIDPIYINSEITPLGKYFMSLSIFLLKNDKFIIIPFGLLSLYLVWLLSKQVIQSNFFAFLPLTTLVFEKLFLNQFIITPLLDIIQLAFILLALYIFIIENKKQKFIFTSLAIGLVMATKTVVPAILLTACFLIFLLLYKRYTAIKLFVITLPLSLGVLLLSYTKTFLDGYTIGDFYRFQKWIFLYQKSKLLFPFSAWRLVFLNQWQTWWGDMRLLRAEDWQITWPVFTALSFIAILLRAFSKLKDNPACTILLLWVLIYGTFLSLGIVSSRFFLPFFPIIFILGFYLIEQVFLHHKISNRLKRYV